MHCNYSINMLGSKTVYKTNLFKKHSVYLRYCYFLIVYIKRKNKTAYIYVIKLHQKNSRIILIRHINF